MLILRVRRLNEHPHCAHESHLSSAAGRLPPLGTSATIMLLSFHLLVCGLALTTWPVPLAAATRLHQSIGPSPPPTRTLTPRPSEQLCPARLFTSAAAQGLLESSQHQFRDNMTARIESYLTPSLLQEVREFWFEHLDHPDSVVVARPNDNHRWYMGGAALDDACL